MPAARASVAESRLDRELEELPGDPFGAGRPSTVLPLESRSRVSLGPQTLAFHLVSSLFSGPVSPSGLKVMGLLLWDCGENGVIQI